MITSWSDSDLSESEDEQDKVANLCFMENGKESEGKLEFSMYRKIVLKKVEGTSIVTPQPLITLLICITNYQYLT